MSKGFGLVEVIVSIAIVAVLSLSFTALTLQSLKVSRINASELQARMYLQELVEVAKDLEQSDWSEILSCSSACYPDIQNNEWKLLSGSETIGIYTRHLSVANVYRSSTSFPNQIVSSGGYLDDNTKKITASISWGNKDLTIDSYVYNLQ